MRSSLISAALLTVLVGLAAPAGAQHTRIEVAVMGTFHFGATSDANRTEVPDLFSARRQRELAEVRARLAAYRPDRIFVENEPSRQAHWDSVSADYRRGILPTGNDLRNEIFQIGVRLADSLGLPGVTCVDYQIPDPDAADYRPRTATEATYADYLTRTYTALDSLGTTNEAFFGLRTPPTGFQSDSLLAALPLREYFSRLNAPDVLQSYDYANFNYWALGYGQGEEYGGADFVINYWMSRNLKIYQNILRHASLDDDRYLVLIGAGHVQTLTNWFGSHPYFRIVPLPTLLD